MLPSPWNWVQYYAKGIVLVALIRWKHIRKCIVQTRDISPFFDNFSFYLSLLASYGLFMLCNQLDNELVIIVFAWSANFLQFQIFWNSFFSVFFPIICYSLTSNYLYSSHTLWVQVYPYLSTLCFILFSCFMLPRIDVISVINKTWTSKSCDVSCVRVLYKF